MRQLGLIVKRIGMGFGIVAGVSIGAFGLALSWAFIVAILNARLPYPPDWTIALLGVALATEIVAVAFLITGDWILDRCP